MLGTSKIINSYFELSSTFDHRTLKARLPVRSALFKQRTGGLVVRWVTTSEYPLLNVFLATSSDLSSTMPFFFDFFKAREERHCNQFYSR
jgi:hypothetical protein